MIPGGLNAYGTGDFWLEFLYSSPYEKIMMIGGIVLIVVGLLLAIILTIFIIHLVIGLIQDHKKKLEGVKDDIRS